MAVDEITKRMQDYEFDLICARMDKKLPREDKNNNINIYRVGFGCRILDKFLLPFWGYIQAKKLYQKNEYDIAWSLMASQASIAAVFLKKKFPQVKLVLTLQEGDEEEYLRRYVGGNKFLYRILIRPWHLSVFRRADFITAISNYLKKRALDNGVKCKISVIPNGVDIDKFSQKFSNDVPGDIKLELNKKEGEKYLIHTGRLNYKNALNDVVQALVYLPDNVKFLQIGKGEELENLRKTISELKLENRVILKNFMEHKDMVKYLRLADIFIRPSLSEGLGNSFLEAMAVGVPIIGTPVGGIPDFLIDGETGLFCEVKNPKSIAEAVKKYIEDKDLYNRIVQNGQKLVLENYSWDKITKQMREVFLSILNT